LVEQQDLNQIKTRMKAMWMSGDFGQIAQYTAREAEQFIARLNLPAGTRLLDVACGTGNLSIPAARAGAVVTGVDIATNLLEAARARARREGVDIKFEEGDAEDLPYADGQFDVVVSMFGAMFAPRPERTAAQLARVCRPGGIIAMANWTPEGFIGQSFQLTSRFAPLPPGVPAPVLWGEEQTARERFGSLARSFEANRRELMFEYPFSPAETVQFHRTYLGPIQAAFARLDPGGQRQLASEMEKLYSERNEGDSDRTAVRAEYLEIRVQRA
jgi:SAM-dependent methyltransferase